MAAISWARYYELEGLISEDWKIASSYKIIAAIIMKTGEEDEGEVVSLGTGNRFVNHIQQ